MHKTMNNKRNNKTMNNKRNNKAMNNKHDNTIIDARLRFFIKVAAVSAEHSVDPAKAAREVLERIPKYWDEQELVVNKEYDLMLDAIEAADDALANEMRWQRHRHWSTFEGDLEDRESELRKLCLPVWIKVYKEKLDSLLEWIEWVDMADKFMEYMEEAKKSK